MVKCPKCSGRHQISFHLNDRISSRGYPTHDKDYATAHEEATKSEKAKFPRKDYNKLKQMDRNTPRDELIGKNTKRGAIEVSKKVPKKLRDEVAYHEIAESKNLKRLHAKKKH